MNRLPSETPAVHHSTATPHRSFGRSRWQPLRFSTAIFLVALSVTFALSSQVPLWHTDLWGHLVYGEIICAEHAIPNKEPIMPLAAEVPVVDSAWLSQVIAFTVFEGGGVAGLQCLYAACITACGALMLWISHRRGRGVVVCLAAAAIWFALQWQQLPVIRPQLAGAVCFLVLLACLSRRRYSLADFVIVPALMMLWANLHGSFIVGLGLLVCIALGRGVDVTRRGKRLNAAAHDSQTRRLLLLALCGGLAVLINPYGAGLYVHALTFARNPNLVDLTEWRLLSIHSQQGQIFTTAAILLIPILYFSPRRVTTAEIVLLLGLGAATVWTSRMIVWFAPIAAYAFALHAGALWNRFVQPALPPKTLRAHWAGTVLAVAAMGAALAYSPWGRHSQNGRRHDFRSAVSSQTPIAAAEFLTRRQPQGQMFNTYEWGDYLAWAGRRQQQQWPIFVASHAHLVPRQVWVDYMAVISAPTDWEERLDRYSVRTVVIDQRYRGRLIARLRDNERWSLEFEDEIAAIFIRKQP